MDGYISISLASLEKFFLKQFAVEWAELVAIGKEKKLKYIHKRAKTRQCQKSILKGFIRSLYYDRKLLKSLRVHLGKVL